MPGTNLWIPFQIQLDSTGSGELEVGAPALGYNWQAFCTLNPAPAGQSQTISVSGQVVASGARQSGPFAAGSGQGVTVAIAGGTASSKVAGVLQGAILPGVAAQAPLPGNGNLFEISGGVVDVSGSDVTIQAGQNGVNVQTETPPQAMGQLATVVVGSKDAVFTFTPPAGATGVRVLIYNSAASSYQLNSLSAMGASSGFNYFPGTYLSILYSLAASFDAEVSGSYEQIDVTAGFVSAPPLGQAVGEVFALFGSEITSVQNNPSQPLYVQGSKANGSSLLVDQLVAGVQGSGGSVQTVRQAPQLDVVVNSTLAAGGSTTLIAGVAGQSIRLRRVQLSTSAAEQIVLRSVSGGGTLFWVGPSGAQVNTPDMDFEGWSLGADVPLVIQNVGSASVSVTGRITADRY